MPRETFHDVDPDTGQPTGELDSFGRGAEDQEAGSINISFTAGDALGIGGYKTNTGGKSMADTQSGLKHGQEQIPTGSFRFVDPFYQKYVPLYNEAVRRHSVAATAALKPLRDQIAVAVALRDKFADKTGWWAGVTDFLTNPLALFSAAAIPFTGGASATIAAKEALSSWTKEMGAEDAIEKLNKKIAELQGKLERKAAAIGSYLPFTVQTVHPVAEDPKTWPKGIVYHKANMDHNGIMGQGQPPKWFMSWFKHKRKMLNQVGVRKFRLT